MDAQYIQTASLNSDKTGSRILFTNLSSQQQATGTLPTWFAAQNSAMQPMPFTHDEITPPSYVPNPIANSFETDSTNLTMADKSETMGPYFDVQARSVQTVYSTPSQRAWGVPDSQLELRASDIY